jgi:hypothetical protein
VRRSSRAFAIAGCVVVSTLTYPIAAAVSSASLTPYPPAVISLTQSSADRAAALSVRMRAHEYDAMSIAHVLSSHREVRKVCYPELPTDEHHKLAIRR